MGHQPSPLTDRERAEYEVYRDMKKSYDQLLVDIHEEMLTTTGRFSIIENIGHSLKRMASLYARAGKDIDTLQKRVLYLTIAQVVLGVIQIIIACFSN